MSATDPLTTPPKAGAGAAGGASRPPQETPFQKWLRTHKRQALLGAGAAAAVGIALWRRHAANAAGGNPDVPAAATPTAADSAGGIPGSYAPYGGDGGGGGGYYGDSGPATGTDAVGLLNALGGVFSALPAPTAASNKFTPTRTTTVRRITVNPPGKHNTTVRTIRTTRTRRRARPRRKK